MSGGSGFTKTLLTKGSIGVPQWAWNINTSFMCFFWERHWTVFSHYIPDSIATDSILLRIIYLFLKSCQLFSENENLNLFGLFFDSTNKSISVWHLCWPVTLQWERRVLSADPGARGDVSKPTQSEDVCTSLTFMSGLVSEESELCIVHVRQSCFCTGPGGASREPYRLTQPTGRPAPWESQRNFLKSSHKQSSAGMYWSR